MDQPPDAHVHDDTVTLTFHSGAQAEGRLVLPPGTGPHPAVLLLHEHGGAFELGWEKLFSHPDAQAAQQRYYGGHAVADTLLSAGFAVLCLDAIGFGRRAFAGPQDQQALAASAMGLGHSLAGIVASEDAQAAAWLAAHPAIDEKRVGAFGFSFGGFRAWQVAALNPVVRAVASVGWMARRADLMRPGAPLLKGNAAFYFLHPAMSARADFPDLASLAADRPLFFRSGLGDPHMPEDSVRAAWQDIAGAARAANGPMPDTGFHPQAHRCPADVLDQATRFLARHL